MEPMIAASSEDRTASHRATLWLAAEDLSADGRHRRCRAEEARVRDSLFDYLAADGRHPRRGAALSHSGGFVAFLDGGETTSGVDLEWMRARDFVALARFAYAADEAAQILAAPEGEQAGEFYGRWVLKESAAKRLGLPLLEALKQCRFEFAGGAIHASLPGVSRVTAMLYEPRPMLRLAWLDIDRPLADPPLRRELRPGCAPVTGLWRVLATTVSD